MNFAEDRHIENRRHVRHKLTKDTVMVFDLGTAKSLGRIENITAGGFLLNSTQPIVLDRIYKISLSLPTKDHEKCVIRCYAKSLWASEAEGLWDKADQSTGVYWTGYEFLDISDTAIQTIEMLVDRLETAQN